jgi:hypothetical protein
MMAALVAGASSADAAWKRIPGSAGRCEMHPYLPANTCGVDLNTPNRGEDFGGGHLLNESTSFGPAIIYPIPDDDRFPNSQATLVRVHFYQPSQIFSARLCVSYVLGSGGVCGEEQISDAQTGWKTLDLPTDMWQSHPWDSHYVEVTMGVGKSGFASKISLITVQ